MTKQRQLILKLVEGSRDHLTASEVFLKAKEELPGIALGTVYRNLNMLADEGRIRRINVPGQPDRYDRTTDRHEHLICRRCGRLKDVRLEGIAEAISKAAGEEVLDFDLSAYYLCENCKNQEGIR